MTLQNNRYGPPDTEEKFCAAIEKFDISLRDLLHACVFPQAHAHILRCEI